MRQMLTWSVSALVFTTGLGVTFRQVTYLWRRPGLFFRSALAMYVVAPLVALILIRFMSLPMETEVALIVLSISAGSPLLPRKLSKFGGDPDFVPSVVVNTSLLAIVTVPISMHLLSFVLPTIDVAPMAIAAVILKSFLVPFGLGMAVRAMAPRFAERFANVLLTVATVVLGVGAVAILFAAGRSALALGWQTWIAFALLAVGALAGGHLLGGRDPSIRTPIALASTTRHIGLAILISSAVPSAATLARVVAFLGASITVSTLYGRIFGKPRGTEPTAS
jgi:predicted Na+-dependent transporter